jgi:BASS family bile acid:Na+ symporter
MDLKQIVILVVQASIVVTVFGLGLKAAPTDLLYLLKQPSLLLRSLISVLVVMPIIAVVLTRMFDIDRTAGIALIALAISPLPPLLPQRGAKGGGHESYGLALMALLALLSIVAVPLSVEILQLVFDRPLDVAPAAVARIVLIMAVIPLVAGVVIRGAAPAFADRIDRPVSLTSRVLLPIAVVLLLAGTWRAALAAVGGGALVTMTAFVVLGLAVGHVFGRPDPRTSVVLALSTACRHPAIALSIAVANFPDENFTGSIVLYLLVNAVIGVAYVKWQQPRPIAVAV